MLRLPPFAFRAPSSVGEVVRILVGEGREARVVAGGTDLWPNMKRRHQRASTVVSLMRIPELAGIDGDSGELVLGATSTLDEVARASPVQQRFPMLARAVASISSPPLRNMGTIGGNVLIDTRCTYYNQTEEWRRSIDYCLKEAGSVCWVAPGSSACWAHSASDAAPALCALNARAIVTGRDGERDVALTDIYRNDGIDYLAMEPDEILTRLLVPAASSVESCRAAFWKLRRRGSIDFAVLSVAAVVWTGEDDGVRKARIFLGAVASQPLEATAAEECLVGRRLDRDSIAEAARLARRAATPLDNTDYKAQWRGLLVERYTEAALAEIGGLPTERPAPPHPQPVI